VAKGPNATPLVADGRLFTIGVSGIVVAWDAATGRELWRKDFSPLVDSTKLFCGTAASPVLAHGHVIVQVGSDVHGGQILALDPATGTTRWTWTTDHRWDDVVSRATYASPLFLAGDMVVRDATHLTRFSGAD
jgi:outer membrane protein assembly factor BamB